MTMENNTIPYGLLSGEARQEIRDALLLGTALVWNGLISPELHKFTPAKHKTPYGDRVYRTAPPKLVMYATLAKNGKVLTVGQTKPLDLNDDHTIVELREV